MSKTEANIITDFHKFQQYALSLELRLEVSENGFSIYEGDDMIEFHVSTEGVVSFLKGYKAALKFAFSLPNGKGKLTQV